MILCIGSLNPAKAQDFVIKSIGTMKEKPSVKFIYNFAYGSTEYKDQLLQLSRELGVSVTFECLVTDGDLVAAYNKAILTVFPSILEPLGLVPLESMACGTPVVGIAEAGIRETVMNNQTGILTERDPCEFGLAINRLIDEKETWQKMSIVGQRWVRESWTWAQAVKILEKNLKKAIASHVKKEK
jgi:glycosyltransferase involved in cell wall biosynthesis